MNAVLEESAAAPVPSAADRWTQWDRFLEASPCGGFMQSSWWADFRVAAGYRHFAAIVSAQGRILGGALVLRLRDEDGGGFYYVPEGPVLPDDEELAEGVFAAFLDAIEQDRRADGGGASHLRIEPRWTSVPAFAREFRALPRLMDRFMEPRDTLCVDLRPPEADILAQMKPKGRYNIQLARRHGVTVGEDAGEQGVEDFLDIYREMTARQGIRAKPRAYFEDLLARLRAECCGSLYFAERGGDRLAAAIMIRFGARATYFFGASRSRDRHLMAPYLLHFELMRLARAQGCSSYDFWGVAPAGDPEHPWRDISSFKRKFGGAELNLVPTLDYVLDAVAYRRYLTAEAGAH